MKFWYMLQHGWILKTYAKWNKPDTIGQICMIFHLNELPGIAKFIVIESRTMSSRDMGKGIMGVTK